MARPARTPSARRARTAGMRARPRDLFPLPELHALRAGDDFVPGLDDFVPGFDEPLDDDCPLCREMFATRRAARSDDDDD